MLNCLCPTDCEPFGCFALCEQIELPYIMGSDPSYRVDVFQGGLPRVVLEVPGVAGQPLPVDLAQLGLIGRLQLVVDGQCWEIRVTPTTYIQQT